MALTGMRNLFEIIKAIPRTAKFHSGNETNGQARAAPVHGMKFFANHKRFGLKFANVGSVIQSPLGQRRYCFGLFGKDSK